MTEVKEKSKNILASPPVICDDPDKAISPLVESTPYVARYEPFSAKSTLDWSAAWTLLLWNIALSLSGILGETAISRDSQLLTMVPMSKDMSPNWD